jgi:glycosyltransferase involved in cell wall biosynthesis
VNSTATGTAGTADLVSVIIPAYNRGYCIERTIRSALDQTHRAIEVCVADDGSKDDTRAVVERLQREDPRVKYAYQQNRGVGAARNLALSIATGEFVAFLDSDDVWHPWKVELQVRALRHLPDAGLVWTDMAAMDPEGKIVAERYLRTMYSAYQWFPGESLFTSRVEAPAWLGADAGHLPQVHLLSGDIYSSIIMGNVIHTSTVLMRHAWARQVGKIADHAPIGEDYDYYVRTCRLGPVAYLDVPAILYQRGRADRLTRPEMRLTLARAFLDTIETALQRDADRITLSERQIRTVRADAHRWIGTVHFDETRYREAAPHLRESLRQDPGQPWLWLKWMACHPPEWMTRSAVRTWRKLRGGGAQASLPFMLLGEWADPDSIELLTDLAEFGLGV